MKKLYTAFFLLLVFSIGNVFGQCMLYPVSLTEKVNNSTLIIEGKVMSQKSFWNQAHNYIYTSNLIEVKQVIKGSVNPTYLEVITMGGEIDMRKQLVEPSLQLKSDETGIFMLNSFAQQTQFGYATYQVFSDQQGFFKFNTLENSAIVPFQKYDDINNDLYPQIEALLNVKIRPYINTVITSNNGGSGKFGGPNSTNAITGISPTTISAGTNSILTITGTGFGTGPASASLYVDFLNADDGGSTRIKPDLSQYVSWTNTQIQVKVPTKTSQSGTAGTGAVRVVSVGNFTYTSGVLTVSYGELNVYYATTSTVYQTRHVELNAAGGVTWQMYTTFDANAAAKASFIRAMQTWRCNTYINWPLGATTSINTIASDGVNVCRFDIGAELPGGVLGVCTSYWGGCTSGPNTYWYVSELDICFDSGTTWNYGPAATSGGQMDFESVALHELGHGHQLSHVINTSNVMHWSIGPNTDKRSLQASDITAGQDVMTRNVSPGVCGKNAMVQIAAASCSIALPTASFNVTSPICAGQVITLTDLSTGSPSNYTWTMTGGTPATANTQNTSTSYSTPGTKTITLIVSNGVGSSAPLSKTLTVLTSPIITVNTAPAICVGGSAVLTASGSTTSYTWTPGNLIGATQSFTPSSTTIYNVVGSNGTCTNSANSTIVVNPSPNMNVNNGVICVGSTTIISVNGATNYTWMPGNLIGPNQILGPSVNTTYTITGETGGCTNTKTVSITVNTCTGIDGKNITFNMNIFPNPTKGNVTVQTSTLFTGDIVVVNAIGQVIMTKKIESKNAFEIDLAEQSNGIYILKVRPEGSSERTMKLIKE